MNLRICSLVFLRAVALACVAPALAFPTMPVTTSPVEGLRDASPRTHALVGARVFIAPGRVIESGTIVLRDGVITAVGADTEVTAPAGARVWDVRGRTIYAGFIESQSELFLPVEWKTPPPPKPEDESGSPPPADPPATGTHAWNPRVRPERDAAAELVADAKGTEAARQLGFTLVHVTPARGVFRGLTALVSLRNGGFNTSVVRAGVAQAVAFETTRYRSAEYPTSLMGAIALVRQSLLDVRWYSEAQTAYGQFAAEGLERPEVNDSLAALGPVLRGEQPLVVATADELEPLRALRVAREFNVKLVLRGSGYEYRVLRALDPEVPVILPLGFPEAPEVETPSQALDFSLDKLEHWELAPANPGRLAAAGIRIALTAHGLKKPDEEFWPRVRKAVQSGLSGDAALAGLTTTPAEIFGVAATRAAIEAGKAADLVVASGDLFTDDDAEVQLVWVDGAPFELDPWRRPDFRGTWSTTWEGAGGPPELQISGASAAKLKVSAAGKEAAGRVAGDELVVLAPGAWLGLEGVVRMNARRTDDTLRGTAVLSDGTAIR